MEVGKTKKQLTTSQEQQQHQRPCANVSNNFVEGQNVSPDEASLPSSKISSEKTETHKDQNGTHSNAGSKRRMEETRQKEKSECGPLEENEEEDGDYGEDEEDEEELEDEEEEEDELEEEEEEEEVEEEEEEEEEGEEEEVEEEEDIEGEEIDVENLENNERMEEVITEKEINITDNEMNLRNIKEVEKKKEKLDVFNKKRKKEAEFITEEEGSSKRKKGKVVQQNETDKEEEEEEEETVISSPIQRKEVETTETETEDSEVEDFPTEGLLQELHFLNASCERRHLQKGALSQVHKTPKKQRKLDFGSPSEESNAREENRSGSSSAKRKRSRKSTAFSPRKLDPDPSPKMKPSKISPLMKGEESEVYQNYNECYTSEDEEDDEGALTIVAHDESPKKRKGTSPPKSKKKMRGEEGTEAAGEVPQEVIELIQSGIDEMLEEKAERTHLTAIHVKNIIKNVMTDENVLAMVRNTVLGIPVGGSAGSAVYEPTLTRAKTRELMEQQAAGRGQSSIWAGLSNHSPGAASIFTPETQALVSVDFPDEDEDEEYKPEADDQLHSDEESLVSASSPCTPSTMQSASTPGSHHSLNFPCSSSRSADIGTPSSQVPVVFKTPSVQEKSVQRVLTFDKEPKQEEVVSQRTRSKLPLTETPLECLEMAFRPPDVTTDMYETEVDNEEWKEFLIDFIHPLKSTEVVEDEEADPEYNILEDKEDALDLREEMRGDRAVQISKKEIQQLMTELLDTLDGDERSEPIRAQLSQHIVAREVKKSPFKAPEICHPNKQQQQDGPAQGSIWVEVVTAEFTPTQLEVLQYQMIQHVQLLTTSVLMTHGYHQYPELKQVADSCMKSLEELKTLSESCSFQSFFNPINLSAGLDLVASLKDMSPYAKPKDEKSSSSNTSDIPHNIVDLVLNSTAFPYPHLLPTRMFQLPTMRSFNKVVFLPSEDVLMALGLERHLDPKYFGEKLRPQHRLLMEALTKITSSILVGKTARQAANRVKNIRSRGRDTSNNPVLQYLETGTLEIPSAVPDPLLPFFSCPVRAVPIANLQNPFKPVVKKQNAVLLKQQKKAHYLECNLRTLEAKFKGFRGIQHQVPNIVIVNPPEGSSIIPVIPCVSNISPLLNFPDIKITDLSIQPPKNCTETETDKSYAISKMPENKQYSQNIQSTSKEKVDSKYNDLVDDVHMVCGEELTSVVSPQAERDTFSVSLSMDKIQESNKNLEGNSTAHPPSQSTENESLEVSGPECDGDRRTSESENTVEKTTEIIPQIEEEDILNDEKPSDIPRDTNNEASEMDIQADSIVKKSIVNNKEIFESLEVYSKNDVTPSSENMPILQCSPNQGSLCGSTTPSTPGKLSPTTTSFPSQDLHLCTPFTTPQKPENESSTAVSLSTSNLCTPILTPPALTNSPEKTLQELRQRNLTAELETYEEIRGAAGKPVKGVSHSKDQSAEQVGGKGKATISIRTVIQTPITPKATSVHEGSVLSKEKEKRSIHLINVTPNKPETRLRKISPAKTFKSPLKTSPLKQVSPILRKYHKYSPKKRNIRSGKLLSILPKFTAAQLSAHRRLAPKPQKAPTTSVSENVSAQGKVAQHSSRCESVLHKAKQHQGENGDLLPLEDQLGGEAVRASPRSRPGQHRLEEDFEEDTLEEEEEEDEDEEEEDEDDDLAAEQQREEHLAALLKASSTITLRRGGGGGDGGVGEHGMERKLTKQQRRLQARISALSSVPDPAAQDKFMAQSYLMRVREALVAQDPACFKRFLFILNDFTENPDRSPIQLYNQLCEVLSDFPHLLEEFVAFLLPQQAIALGKYAQYCAIHRMRDFLEKLELQFGKQPQYIQKIIRLLQTFQGRPSLDLAEVKTAITPLLRYPHLVESFTQCFPSQPPPPSLQSDFEDLKLERSGSVDSVEDLVLPDDDTSSSPSQCACPCHSNAPSTHHTQPIAQPHTRTDHCHSCALRFSEGRVYLQCGKTLRPARVTYTDSHRGVKVTPFGESNSDAQGETAKESTGT